MTKRKDRHSSSSSQSSISQEAKISKSTEDTAQEEEEEAAMAASDKIPSLTDIWQVLLTIKDNTAHLTNEFDNLKKAFSSQEKVITKIKEENNSLKVKMAKMEEEAEEARVQSQELVKEQDRLEQYTRKNSLEIVGIPVLTHFNCEEIVLEIANKLEVDISSEDIEITHRLTRQRRETNTSSRPIIVKFLSHKKKTELLKARIKLKDIKLSDIFPDLTIAEVTRGARHIFINENLTSQRRKLLGVVIRMKKERKVKSFWSRDGKIFVKKEEMSDPVMISSNDDIFNL